MQIDITTLSEMNAFNLSHSQAEGGENAMQNTWKNSRELGADSLSEIDWQEAEVLQSEGEAPSNIYKGDDGKIYFYLGN